MRELIQRPRRLRRNETILGLDLPLIALAPFDASAAAKLRLALRAFTEPGLPAIMDQ